MAQQQKQLQQQKEIDLLGNVQFLFVLNFLVNQRYKYQDGELFGELCLVSRNLLDAGSSPA
jgi:hypothetical protein